MPTAAGMVFAEFAAACERPKRRFPRHLAGGEHARIARLVDLVTPEPRVVVAGPPDTTTATRSYPK
jgi:hypothetical protein